MNSLLIIDDDVELGIMLRGYLSTHEMLLDISNTGDVGLRAAASKAYDLMLLDVTLPDLDGFELLQRIRAHSDVPVILLTARGETTDRVRGLQLGADDYLSKPFDPDELIARIRAILRRRAVYPRPEPAISVEITLCLGDLEVQPSNQSARYRGVSLNLTDIELGLLTAFMQSTGVVLDREVLMIQIFGRPFHPLNRTLDMHISRLRRKLRLATTYDNLIKTIRGVGYQFSASDLQRQEMKFLSPIQLDRGAYAPFNP
jgi:two-component system, OmpR family, response regulator CpxR